MGGPKALQGFGFGLEQQPDQSQALTKEVGGGWGVGGSGRGGGWGEGKVGMEEVWAGEVGGSGVMAPKLSEV